MINNIMLGPIYVFTQTIDFRKGIDGLCGLCKKHLLKNPIEGGIYVFSNKSRQSIKILFYDGQGFWLYQKRVTTHSLGCRNLTKSLQFKSLTILPKFILAAGCSYQISVQITV